MNRQDGGRQNGGPDHGGPQQGGLDALFAQARAERPEPGADLLARVMADAAGALPRTRPAAPQPWRRALRGIAAAFGGSAPLAGMASAAVAGLWIGFSAPEPLLGLVPLWQESDEAGLLPTDLLPDIDTLLLAADDGQEGGAWLETR